jgi:BioD-like phosphotransacetylase family protein
MSKTTNLYVCSPVSYCGKSAICLGMALKLRDEGFQVGYFKPIGWEMLRGPNGEKIDEDAQLMNDALNLDLPMDLIAPIIFDRRFLEESSRFGSDFYAKKVNLAYEEASKQRDVMVIEGAYAMGIGASIGLDCASIAREFKCRVVLVATAQNDNDIDQVIWYANAMAAADIDVLGVILNRVPRTDLERVKRFALPVLREYGIKVLGVMPENTNLRAPTVREICESTQCEILTCEDHLDNLVEDFLVGAMNPESALSYFRRSLRKAVITGGDRTDIQLAALQTDTSTLILTGNLYPDARVLARAEEQAVPVLLVPTDTYTTVTNLATLSGRIKPTDERKIALAKELVSASLDWEYILSELRNGGP